jgi:WD40 repeat protein
MDQNLDPRARRELQLAANRAKLQELGLYSEDVPSSSHKRRKDDEETTTRREPRREPLRRSTRGSSNTAGPATQSAQLPSENELHFLASSVASSYEVYASAPPSSDPPPSTKTLYPSPTFRIDKSDPPLNKTYTMQYHPTRPLLACGGPQGRVSVFAVEDKTTSDAALSWKVGPGWVSSVRWLDQGGLLLTADNDGAIQMWDVAQENELGAAKLLASDTNVHDGGVFDLKVYGQNVFTASKDKSVAVCTVAGPSLLTPVTKYRNAHAGVVKTVDAKSNDVFASGGNDSVCKVWDTRLGGAAAVELPPTEDKLAINCVVWHPGNEFHVLLATFGSTMEMHDIRGGGGSTTVVGRFTGHCPPGHTRSPDIYKPVFVGTKYVLACGGQATRLTLFDSQDAHLVSSGEVNWQPSNFAYCASTSEVAAAHGKTISFFQS